LSEPPTSFRTSIWQKRVKKFGERREEGRRRNAEEEGGVKEGGEGGGKREECKGRGRGEGGEGGGRGREKTSESTNPDVFSISMMVDRSLDSVEVPK
jgi:hypothetical protein